ncbi:MAG: c-type cytochrome [Rhizobiales bacterium]|nr:c-type cytochrome [Hyphomicrobiales bacterium]
MTFARSLLAVSALALLSVPAMAGDAAKGKDVAKLCIACHSVTDAKNKVGPSLVGIVGRPIASVADYKYSDNLKEYAATAGAWDDAKLDSYIENPKKDVPKGKMAFGGVKDATKRADLIAYLATLK